VDAVDADRRQQRIWSKPVVIGPAVKVGGMPALTQKEAKRLAWDNHLSRLDQNQQTPLSMMTVGQFVERRFTPGHVRHLKKSGRSHYANMLKHVLPVIGPMRLCDVRKEHVQNLVNRVLDRLSWQTAKHVKNTVSAIFTFAEGDDSFSGTNPAKHVNLGESRATRRPRALTFDEARQLLECEKPDLRAFCEFLLYTSCNVSEAVGLQWRYVNLNDEWASVDGEAIPPRHIAIRHQLYRGEFGSVKARPRVRNLPLPGALLDLLAGLYSRGKHIGPDDWVFTNEEGGPFDEHNQVRRHLKLAAALAGLGTVERDERGRVTKFSSWVGWHTFRHTHSTWTKTVGLGDYDRMRLMGHAALSMTDRYTHEDTERQRSALERIAERLAGDSNGKRVNVVEIRKKAG
jgi:integrase